tara:strand:- start:19 stop:2451 length:2433 start_codon:yes stop_codon:yes gene_type:complete
MSLNLVSPGTKVREVDLTIGRVDAINEQVGAIAGPFEKGPVNVPILIETEQDLINTFGKPISTDSQYEYWLSASSYLSYGGVLRVVRTDNENLNNANNNAATVKVESYDDYVENHTTDSGWNFAAKDPGRWANNLKVCTIDAFADQIISGVSTASVVVGAAVTQTLDGRDSTGIGVTSTYDGGFLRGIVTGVGVGEIYVRVTDQVSAASTIVPADYKIGSENTFKNATSVTTTSTTSTGIGTGVLGIVNEAFDASITGIATTAGSSDIASNLALGDVVTVTGGNSTVSTGTTIVGFGVSTIFVSEAISGISTVGDGAKFSFSRSSSSSSTTNVNTIYVVGTDGATDATFTASTNKDWWEEQKLSTTNSTVYWKSIATKPGTSEYASQRSSSNDEIHVVVVDDDGSVTGVSGNIVEKHLGLSKALDGKISPAENIYWKDYLATKSNYIYGGTIGAGNSSSISGVTGGVTWTPTGKGNWNANTQGVTFSVNGNQGYTLTGGENYSASGGYGATLANVVSGYEKFKNQAEYDINFLIQGPSGGASMQESQAKANYLISLADLRKDCIACISPHKSGVINVSNTDTQTDNIIDFFDPINSSSYAVFDSGYKYVFDRFNNKFRWVALNADVAGTMCRTSVNQYSWFSPAGASRGTINSAVKLAYNPSQAQRDLIYPKRINPVIFSPGAGIVLFGDKTGLGYASAFDRINVRRLFLTIEQTIERSARAQLFEFNDVITRSNFVNIVEPYLRDVKSKRGITDFVVICDETNNTPDIIDANQFKADIFVKPARSINFIGLTFVATRTGVSFEEVVGNV